MTRTLVWGLLALALTGCSDDSGGGFLVPDATCLEFCGKVVDECEALPFSTAQCQDTCQRDVNSAFGQSRNCGEAFEAFFQCVTALSCEEVEDWRDENPPDGYPCQDAVEAANDACPPSM